MTGLNSDDHKPTELNLPMHQEKWSLGMLHRSIMALGFPGQESMILKSKYCPARPRNSHF